MTSYTAFSRHRNQEVCNRFLDLVAQHFTDQRCVKFYADQLCYTPKYLARLILDASGKTATEHIDAHVIDRAKSLIGSYQYTMGEISEMLHFSTQANFSRFFKHETGITPRQYSESIGK